MVHNLQTLKKVCILLLLVSLPGLSFGQELARTIKPMELDSNQDTEKNMVPLVKVLEDLEARFKVHFNYNSELLEDKMVKKQSGAGQENVEKALQEVLGPLNLRFELFQQSQKNYLIFQKVAPQAIKKLQSRRGIEIDGNLMVKKHLSELNLTTIKSNRIFQEVTVTGKITAADEGNLPGVNVVEKGTTNGTVTDIDGNYKLQVNSNATLVFSSVGYETVEMPLGNRSVIDLEMQPDIQQLQEIIVVGFGRQSSITTTGAISSLKAEDLENTAAVTMGEALSGKTPGLVTVQMDGQPGNQEPEIFLRGMGTLNNNEPLIIIDGVPNTMRTFMHLNATDIQNISVLKDASATAVYGVRGANGVIIVDTKRGEAGKTRITVDAFSGVQIPTQLPDFAESYDWAMAYNEMFLNDGDSSRLIPQAQIEHYRKQDQPLIYPSHNWIDQALDDYAFQAQANLNLSGGSEDIKFFTSVNYLKQEGLVSNFGNGSANFSYDRVNLRVNSDIDITSSTNLSFSSFARIGVQREPRQGTGGDSRQRFYMALQRATPMNAVGVVDGRFIRVERNLYAPFATDNNPISEIYGKGFFQRNENRLNINLDLRQKLDVLGDVLKGLEFRSKVGYQTGYDTRMTQNENNWGAYISLFNKDAVSPDPTLGDSVIVFQKEGEPGPTSWNYNYGGANRYLYWEAGLDYQRTFGFHQVGALLLYNQNKDYYPNLAFGNIPTANVGLVGRVSYNYQQKYLFEVNLGYNGSENFAREVRFGLFPSVSGGWVLSEESFLQDANFLSFLKFRYSYGVVGSDQAGRLSRFIYIGDAFERGGDGYNFGNEVPENRPGTEEGAIGNPEVTWETAEKQNFGVDIKLFEDKFSLSADYFTEYRDNILTNRRTNPYYIGFSLPPINIGEVENKGFEIVTSWSDNVDDFSYTVSANFMRVRNTILFMDEIPPVYDYQSRTGHPMNSPYGYIFEGFYTAEQAQIIAEERDLGVGPGERTYAFPLGAFVEAGDVKWADLNDDGVVDDQDRKVYGHPYRPQIMGGLNLNIGYQGFDLTIGFQGAAEVSRDLSGWYRDSFSEINDEGLWQPLYDYRWTPETAETAEFPRLTNASQTHNTLQGSLWTRDASYIRLRSAEIGYTFGDYFLDNIGVQNVRVYLRGMNLFTIQGDDYRWFDPEKSSAGGGGYHQFYPLVKTVFAGLNIQF